MKIITKIAGWIIVAILVTISIYMLLGIKTTAHEVEATIIPTAIVELTEAEKALDHRQEVWISSLEWCESRGVKTAVNKVDLDGTSSWYSFQFKPGTFRWYGEKYNLIATGTTGTDIMEKMLDYDLARKIVKKMVNDKSVNFLQQFPDCVRNKIGQPPRS